MFKEKNNQREHECQEKFFFSRYEIYCQIGFHTTPSAHPKRCPPQYPSPPQAAPPPPPPPPGGGGGGPGSEGKQPVTACPYQGAEAEPRGRGCLSIWWEGQAEWGQHVRVETGSLSALPSQTPTRPYRTGLLGRLSILSELWLPDP